MPAHHHMQRPPDHEPRPRPPDDLDAAYRQMLAQTMRPCRELSRDERAAARAEAHDRNTVLATWYGAATELRAV